MFGLHPHSKDYHTHFTRSGKQREIVRYKRPLVCGFCKVGGLGPLEEEQTQSSIVWLLDSKMVLRCGEGERMVTELP